MYNLSEVKTDHGVVYLEPGLHDVTVTSVTSEEPDNKAPRIVFTFENAEGTSVQNFYMSEKAEKNSLINVKHVVATVAGEDNANIGEVASLEELATAIDAVCANKKCKIKLSGEYYNGTLRGKFGFRPFVSSVKATLLTFNPDSDIKKDTSADMMEGLAMPAANAGGELADMKFEN